MKKKLSSDFTPLYKTLWIAFVIGLGIILFVTDMPAEGKLAYFICWAIGASLFWRLFNDLRIVEADTNFLYVKDGGITATIPVSIIESVKQEWILFRYPTIVIKLKIPTKFGLEIKFIPYYAFTLFYQQHPVVNELKHLANLA